MGKNNGGPAFPNSNRSRFDATGMTLRDYFAAKALPMVSKECEQVTAAEAIKELGIEAPYDYSVHWPALIAKRAYEMADAMLAARGEA